MEDFTWDRVQKDPHSGSRLQILQVVFPHIGLNPDAGGRHEGHEGLAGSREMAYVQLEAFYRPSGWGPEDGPGQVQLGLFEPGHGRPNGRVSLSCHPKLGPGPLKLCLRRSHLSFRLEDR